MAEADGDKVVARNNLASFTGAAYVNPAVRIIRYQNSGGEVHFASLDQQDRAWRIDGSLSDFRVTGEEAEISRILTPIDPSGIFCVGLNYRKHAEESGVKKMPDYPILFMKSLNAVQAPASPIFLPRFAGSSKVDYEAELAVVISKPCKNVTVEEALDYVLGYTCANDVSARDWQLEWGGRQFCRGKSFDSFCPLGPCLATPDEVGDVEDIKLRSILNGEVMQEGNTGDMIFSVPELIAFLSQSTTLLPGTVILTGTPEGVGMARNPPRFLKSGDAISVDIEGIGILTNPVLEETETSQRDE